MIMDQTIEITIDIQEEKTYSYKEFSQNNLNNSSLVLNITDGGEEFLLKDTDEIILYFKKPDKKMVFQKEDIEILDKEKGKIKVLLTSQILVKDGPVYGELSLERVEDGIKKRINSYGFTFGVRPSLASNDAIESTNEFQTFDELVELGKQDIPAIIASKEVAEAAKAESEKNTNQIGVLAEFIADKVGGQKTIDLFMTMGQSNMAGRGEASQAPVVPIGTAYEFRAISDPTKLYDLIEPFGVYENNKNGINEPSMKTGSLVSSFAISYYKSTKVPAVFVSASKGGSGIAEWQPGTKFLKDAINRFNSAKKWLTDNGYIIRNCFMLWSQGETDGDNGMRKFEYTAKLNAMIKEMFDAGIQKCFMIRTGNNRDAPFLYDDIIEAQSEFCKTKDNVILVSNKFAEFADRGLMKDQFHYVQSAYNEAGEDAGVNCASYVNSGVPPVFADYKYNSTYQPYKVDGDKKLSFPFRSENENGMVDIVKCGEVRDGYIDTNNIRGYKQLWEPIVLSAIREWSLEFTIHPSQEVSGTDSSGIIFGNAGSISKNFLFVNNVGNVIRIRDSDGRNFDFSVPKEILDGKHSYCITYNGSSEMTLYIDKALHQTIPITAMVDIVFENLFGGNFNKNNVHLAAYDYKGICWHIGYINKSLKPYQMHAE